jgi:heme-degrading monooxygenase HmoA
MAASHHIAHVNISLPRAPLSSALLADFVAALEPVNELAERSPGFVWRLQLSDADTMEARAVDDDRLIVTLSVWETLESLRAFSYDAGRHREALGRRREWFVKLDRSNYALWWIAAGHRPTPREAQQRLEHLDEHGPTPFAFTFGHCFHTTGGRDAHPRSTHRAIAADRGAARACLERPDEAERAQPVGDDRGAPRAAHGR